MNILMLMKAQSTEAAAKHRVTGKVLDVFC